MTINAKGLKRSRLVKLAAGASLAGSVLGLIGADVAKAAVSAPTAVTATLVAGPALNVNWFPPSMGTATIYKVEVDDFSTAGVDFTQVVFAPTTSLNGIAVTPGKTYNVRVSADDGSLAPSWSNWATPVVVPPAVPVWTKGCYPVTDYQPWCTVADFVKQQYQDWAGRAPLLNELNYWVQQIVDADWSPTDGDPAPGTSFTQAGIRMMNALRVGDYPQANKDTGPVAGPVTRLYVAMFLRNPEYSGYMYWLGAAKTGMTMESIANFFANSPEFQARYGTKTNAEFVSLVYNNAFSRNPDMGGFNFWMEQLNSGKSRGYLLYMMAETPEFTQKSWGAALGTEIYAAMLKRVPTPAEYWDLQAAGTGLLARDVYNSIVNKVDYLARITPRFP